MGRIITNEKRIALELFFFLPILILVDEYILMPYMAWQFYLGTGIGVEDDEKHF